MQEGTIVRAITRLDETCREVRDAARIVGNADLFTKMEQCQLKIRRDIVFCASLYVSPRPVAERRETHADLLGPLSLPQF